MSADGAHLGVSADRALKTILGGDASPTEFRTWIKTCPDNEGGYEGTARLAARYLLEYLTAHPEDIRLPLDDKYDYARMQAEHAGDMPPLGQWLPYRTAEGLWDRAAAEYPLKELDMTGFMAGWAFNAARRCIELPPAPNPALLTIGGDA